MKVIFARNNSIASILIRLITWSRWHHCGVLTADSKYIIEATALKGVIKTPINEFMARYKKTDTVEIVCDDKEARVFLYNQVGKCYDFKSVVAIFFRIKKKPDNHWYCFELIAAASGLFRDSRVSRITGSDLWAISKDIKQGD
tara:strand:+ start:4870 stop:5298 length:429 start_codon:yes stop_codon:yes gene_type:complete